MNCFGLVLFLALSAAVLADSERAKRQASVLGTCGPPLFLRLSSSKCCSSLPKLIPEDVKKECGIRDPSATFKNAQNKLRAGQFPNPMTAASNFVKLLNDTKSPFCALQCAFKKLGLFDESTGKVNLNATQGLLVQNVPDEWKSAAETAASTCNTLLADAYNSFNATSMKGPKPKCMPCSLAYSACINAQLYVNCPSLSTSGTCSKDIETLKACSKNITSFIGLPPRRN